MSLTPLSHRVIAPSVLPEPADRDGIEWRVATIADLDAIVGVYEAMADADHPTWAETREEVIDDLESSWVDLALDTRIAFSGGRAIAFGEVSCRRTGETVVRAELFGGVVPDHRGRGIGRALLAWQIARAEQQLAEVDLPLPGWISASAEADTDRIALFERAGLPAARWYFKLERDLGAPIPELAVPDGLRLETVTPERWDEMLEVKNAAFRDHWGSQPMSAEQWDRLMTQSSARHDLSLVALDGDRIVGLLTTLVIPEDIERQGYPATYIQLIGVVREWRRRGVAPALIAAALRAARAEGFERTGLHVDADNPTGALRLYEGMGFVAVERSQSHVLVR